MTTSKLDTAYCHGCGAPLRIEDLFCANCGRSVPDAAPRASRAEREQRAARRDWDDAPVDGTGERYGSRPDGRRPPWSERGAWSDGPSAGAGSSSVEPAWWEETPSSRAMRRDGPTYPATVSDSSRLWAAAAPLGIVAGVVFSAGLLSFVIPLLVWQLRKGSDTFAAEHGREALNAMLSLVVYALVAVVIAVPVTIFTLGIGLIVMLFAAGVVGLVFLISLLVATVRALGSRPFRYPLMIRFFRR